MYTMLAIVMMVLAIVAFVVDIACLAIFAGRRKLDNLLTGPVVILFYSLNAPFTIALSIIALNRTGAAQAEVFDLLWPAFLVTAAIALIGIGVVWALDAPLRRSTAQWVIEHKVRKLSAEELRQMMRRGSARNPAL